MTDRERRLRSRIDTVTAQRDEARDLAKKLLGRKRRFSGRCIYCGRWCRSRACSDHADLLAIERAMVTLPEKGDASTEWSMAPFSGSADTKAAPSPSPSSESSVRGLSLSATDRAEGAIA